MAGQGVQRREVLRMLATAAAVATFPGFSKWSIACGHSARVVAQIKPALYRPIVFTAPEYSSIERLAEIIIPSDDTPGASEAGVSEFLDVMASRDPGLQRHLRAGLAWLDLHSHRWHGKHFLALELDQQIALLEPLAYEKKFRAGDEDGREFFERIREYTIMGFYTSKVGLAELDFPGLKFYSASPSCPHQGDPEHLHLDLAPVK
jgi:gluconate 2-dehydrogenase gamma chain